jgi:hypothetical protein
MNIQCARLLNLFAVAVVTAACVANPKREDAVLPDDWSNPKKVKFVRYLGNVPAEPAPAAEAHLPIRESIVLESRRYAEKELRKRGWCSSGFVGPDLVIGNESDRSLREFTVHCQ